MSDQTARGPAIGGSTFGGPTFPTTCARCGGRLSGPVSFCPHCGTPARLAFGERTPPTRQDAVRSPGPPPNGTAGTRAGASRAEMLWPSRPTPLFASADSDPYGDAQAPSAERAGSVRWGIDRWGSTIRRAIHRWTATHRRTASHHWAAIHRSAAIYRSAAIHRWAAIGRSSDSPRWSDSRWGIKRGTALTLLAFFALFGGTVLLHRYDDAETREQQQLQTSVQGTVKTTGTEDTHDASTASRQSAIARGAGPVKGAAAVKGTGTDAAQRPATASTTAPTSANIARETNRAPQAVAAPAMPQAAPPARITQQAAEPAPSLSRKESSATSGKYSAKNQRLMSLALARAHNGFEKNDLRMARSGVYWALSLQPDNSEALSLKQELLARERGHVAASKAFDSGEE
ncbi:hypothetical protein [Trinickia sp. EG282A]|uniref:hypothetical protein n=1 Tax=Trinickia sp. EG282A TaxID=3237013 RepID=UPI0034D268A2